MRGRRVAVGPVFDGVQPRDGRDGRGSAVGDDHRLARRKPLFANLDGAEVDQLALAPHQPGPGGLEGGGGAAVVQVPGHPEDTFGDLWKVDGPLHAGSCERACPQRLDQGLAGAQERLGRDAAPVRTFTAHELPLDDDQREPAALEPMRDRLSRNTAAQANNVNFLRQLLNLHRWCGRRMYLPGATFRAEMWPRTSRGTSHPHRPRLVRRDLPALPRRPR